MHYLNHAACGLMSDATRNTMHAYMCQEQQMGSYLAAKQVHKDIASVYQKIAKAIHARPEDIALTQGNSDGWGRIISSMDWRQGGRIEEMPCNADGLVDIDALDRLLQTPTSLVVLTWFSSNSPLIQPAQTIGALCAQYRTPLLIDAAQAMGQWHIDVQALQCTALTAPGRKWLRGPRGTGFAYVHPDFLPSLHPLGADHFSRPWQTDSTWVHRTDAKKLELSESSIALRLGLSQTFDEWNAAGAAKVQEQIQERAT